MDGLEKGSNGCSGGKHNVSILLDGIKRGV